jgi:hypothetical protein
LDQYHQIIKQKFLESDDNTTSSPRNIDPHLEAIHYLQCWEFMVDRNDSTINEVFSAICIPNNAHQGELNIDFSKYSVEAFLKEIMKLKN